MKRVAGWVVGALVGWLILSALGEDTAAVILSAAPDAAGGRPVARRGLMVRRTGAVNWRCAGVWSSNHAKSYGDELCSLRGCSFCGVLLCRLGHWGSPRLEPIPDCRDHRRMYGCWRCCTASSLTHDRAVMIRAECILRYCGGDPVGKVDPSGEAWRHSISTTTGVITRLRYATHANLFSREPNAVVSHALEATWYYRIDWYWDPARNVCYATATITVTKVNDPTPNVRMYMRAEAVTGPGSATAARTTSGLSYWPSARGSWRYGRVGAGYKTRTLSARSFKSLRMSLTLQTHRNSVVFPKSASRVVNVRNPYFDRTKGRQQR